MYFELKNIGAIKNAKIELGELTVICGKNNTGKTYITYSIYGFLYNKYSLYAKTWANFSDPTHLINKAEFINFNQQLSKLYTQQLGEIFNVNQDEFANSEFNVHIDYPNHVDNNDESELLFFEILYNYFGNSPALFIVSAERTGIQLFQKELDKHRNELIKKIDKTRDFKLLEEGLARFALPIDRNIEFARDYDNIVKSNSFLKQEYPELVSYIEDMLEIKYEIIDGRKVVIDKTTNQALPYHMASTSVHALFDLHLWLKHFVEKGNILFIDEPELNLHPGNQIKIARLLVKLVNAGIKVFITTHSDYIVKELNNLLMLANEFPEKSKLMDQYGYKQDDILHTKDLKANIANTDGTVSPVEVDEYGMIQSGFDDAIVQINEASNQIVSAVEDWLES